MVSDEELQRLRNEVADLKKRRDTLREIRTLKLEKLKQKLKNLFPAWAARHPYITTAGELIGEGVVEGAKYLGPRLLKGAKYIAKNVQANERTDARERRKNKNDLFKRLAEA